MSSALTLHDTRVAPDHENTAVMQGFPHPGPLPEGEGDKERLRRIFTVTAFSRHSGSLP